MKKNVLMRVLCLALALVMSLSMFACGGDSGSGNNKATESLETHPSGKEHVTLVMYTQAQGDPGREEMIAAVNEYLEEKLNVTLDLRVSADYSSTMGTRIDAGENWDICLTTVGSGVDFQSYAERNAFAPLDDYIDLLPKTTAQLIEGGLDSFKYDDSIYAIPILKDMFERNDWTINQTLLDECGVSFPENFATKWDLLDFFFELKEARDEVFPEDEDTPILQAALYNYDQWYVSERLVGGWNIPLVDVNISEEYGYEGIPLNDTAFCPIYTQEYRDVMKAVRDLVQEGVASFDPKTFDADRVLLNSGKLLGTCGSGLLDVPEDLYPGFKSKFYSSSICYAADYQFAFAINSKCENVERAVELLELMQNDTYLATTLHFGKEGSGWTDVDNDNVIELTEKNSNPTNRWWYQWYGWPLGGVTAMKVIPGSAPDYMEQLRELNKNSVAKPNRGFKFDKTDVVNELAAVNDVFTEYHSLLETGQNANVDEIIDNFIQELKANGMDTIVAEAQRQLDEWRAANGK